MLFLQPSMHSLMGSWRPPIATSVVKKKQLSYDCSCVNAEKWFYTLLADMPVPQAATLLYSPDSLTFNLFFFSLFYLHVQPSSHSFICMFCSSAQVLLFILIYIYIYILDYFRVQVGIQCCFLYLCCRLQNVHFQANWTVGTAVGPPLLPQISPLSSPTSSSKGKASIQPVQLCGSSKWRYYDRSGTHEFHFSFRFISLQFILLACS